jgi:hypothetical protein
VTYSARAWIWEGVDRLLDRAPSLEDLRAHQIELLAARRLRARDLEVPAELADEELRAAMTTMAASALLERVRSACDGPILLVKGPEIAVRYPDPALRAYGDLDLIVPDAAVAQRALIAAGFVEVGDPELYVGIHHLRPLQWPTLPLFVEVHDQAKWPAGLEPPRLEELLAVARPCTLGVDRVLALPRAHHAVVVAAHAWAHVPLWRLRDVIDVAALADGESCAELDRLASRFGVRRLWRSTATSIESVLGHRPPTPALRTWARHLPRGRERTVLENHLEQTLSPFSMLRPLPAARFSAGAIARQLQPSPGERRGQKATRTAHAMRNALRRVSSHEQELEISTS